MEIDKLQQERMILPFLVDFNPTISPTLFLNCCFVSYTE